MKVHKAKIGVKYCGGCNPGYDRVALTEHIKMVLKDKFVFTRPEEEGVSRILAVQGCATACADLSPFEGKITITISSIKDKESVIREIQKP